MSAPLPVHVGMKLFARGKELIFWMEQLPFTKLFVKRTPNEIQGVMGWSIDTIQLIISLFNNKYLAHRNNIQKIINWGHVTKEELELVISRLNHALYVFLLTQHFLSELHDCYQVLKHCQWKYSDCFTFWEIEGLKLWLKLLATANRWILLYGLTIQKPTRITFSDYCQVSFRGFTSTSQGWRLKYWKDCNFNGHYEINNVLEFLIMTINILLSIIKYKNNCFIQELIIALSNNTTVVACLTKTSGLDKGCVSYNAAKLIVQKLVTVIKELGNYFERQYMTGVDNVIAN